MTTLQDITAVTEKTAQKVVEKTERYQDAYQTIQHLIDNFWERVPYICIGLVVFLIFWVFSKIFKYFLKKTIIERTPQRQNLVLVLYRVGSIIILFVGFLIALVIIIPSFTPAQLVGSLGIGSVAIGFAFKDIFQNLLSGILILLGEPFKIGDYIQVNGLEGTVEDIQIRATYLRSADGRRIVIPNATVYISPITVNTAYTHRRCEFNLTVADNINMDEIKQYILEQLNQQMWVLKSPEAQVYVQTFDETSVKLMVRWWINTEHISIHNAVSEMQMLMKDYLQQRQVATLSS